jgi:magnesium transporter
MKKLKKKLIKRRPRSSIKIGLPPGSLIHVGEVHTDKSVIEVSDYNAEKAEHFVLEKTTDLYPYLENNDMNTWVRFTGLHDTKLIGDVGAHIEIHPLVLEDIVNTNQRSKVEDYDDYMFIVVRHINLNKESTEFESQQIGFILSKGCVISYHEKHDPIFDAIKTRMEIPNGRFKKFGSDYLLYALLDLVVDNYFSVLDEINDDLAPIEEELLNNSASNNYENLHAIRRKLILMRRHISPARDVINTLVRDENNLISDEVALYYRDINDHLSRVLESLEHTIEISSTLIETHMTQVGLRANEVMKVLTIIATIFIPLTFVAGIYGMNFDPDVSPYNMPELQWFYGYPASLLLMFAITIGMLIYFKKKKWI